MTRAYINKISTAVPGYDVHEKFLAYAPSLIKDERMKKLFKRMADRSEIEHRYSFFEPEGQSEKLDKSGFYQRGSFPDTKTRMEFFKAHAFELAQQALDKLITADIKNSISHVIVTTCTGFYAPGLDLQIVEHYQLNHSTERTMVGFMGCYAAFNALKLAAHIVRSNEKANVLILNLELCTLHLQEVDDLEQLLSFLIFADGCAASLVSAQPVGLKIESFHSTILPETGPQITWHIGHAGFDMFLSGEVPRSIAKHIPAILPAILNGAKAEAISYWAIHPGGRSILDAVQENAGLSDENLAWSRSVLRRFGNMSSATVMFVLKDMLECAKEPGLGCAMAFGPGVTVEAMTFCAGG